MSERVFYRRQFLNNEEEGGTAFIDANVHEAEIASSYSHLQAEFSVADCSRMVTLAFSAGNDADSIANIRQKVKKFRRAVVAFEAALLPQLDELERGL